MLKSFRFAPLVFAVSSPSLRAQEEIAGPLEFGAAAGEPGEVVAVEVRATFDYPMVLLFVPFQFDPERLVFLRYDVTGTAAEGLNPLRVGSQNFQPGEATFGLFDHGQRELGSVPPGERQLLGRLLFLVRAAAEEGEAYVRPVERIQGPQGGPQYSLDVVARGLVSYRPSSLVGGAAEVLPPSGPRPVGDLACEQFLDRILLSFTPVESYEEISIHRDGELIATLPGAAASYTDPQPRKGLIRYAVVARRGAEESLPATCEVLAVSPAAPPVEDLQCADSGLIWTNPVLYDRIFILRDGELIAEVAGSAQRFTDPDRPEVLTVYTVLGDLEGYRSPQTSCLHSGVWIMEVGDVQVPVDAERVVIPIYVTTCDTIDGMGFCLDIDTSRFELIRDVAAALEGTVGHHPPEFLAMGQHGGCGHPAAGIFFDYVPPQEDDKDFPPGLRQRIFNFVFRPVGPMAAGETFDVSLVAGGDGGTVFSDDGASIYLDVNIPGKIRFGSSGVPAVQNLATRVDAPAGEGGGGGGKGEKDVRLTWDNPSSYDGIRIERNGAAVAEIPGDATEYVDASVPQGVFTYKVTSVQEGRTGFPSTAFLSTFSPAGAFLRGDATRDGRIGIADPIRTLMFLFLGGVHLPCEDAADTDDSGVLGLTDAVLTLQYLFLGGTVIRAPGTRYPWFDPTSDALGCLE
ncbi:MAG: hypothetical protein JXA90_07575 [Planctomycetes bacterium]|nr:hypothetical protein [Planctomycetota bacterium]